MAVGTVAVGTAAAETAGVGGGTCLPLLVADACFVVTEVCLVAGWALRCPFAGATIGFATCRERWSCVVAADLPQPAISCHRLPTDDIGETYQGRHCWSDSHLL